MTDPAVTAFLKERENLIGIACKIVQDHAIAEDLVQESWLRWSGRDYPQEKAAPIFKRIVTNLARDFYRGKRREAQFIAEFGWQLDGMPSSERAVSAREELKQVVVALRSLPPRTVDAFRMHFVDGMTYAETGKQLGISLSRAHALAEDALVAIAIAVSR